MRDQTYQPDNCPAPFLVLRPDRQAVPFVYNAPHSGTYYPPDLLALSRLPLAMLRSSEDSFADRLFASVPNLGAPLLRVNYARAYVDTNREPDELDPGLFDGELSLAANARSDRVRAGLGIIPAVVAAGQRIYATSLPASEAPKRIDQVYRPAHHQLQALLQETLRTFSCAVLIDCHSMPSGTTLGRQAPRQTSDIVLGDAHGQSCAPIVTEVAARTLRDLGYRVALNSPYAGGYNTHFYGRPTAGQHALQIEVNRALYMDERRFEPTTDFARVAGDMERLTHALHAIPASDLQAPANTPMAAE